MASSRVLSFSIVAGSTVCNARCPFCVAGMTPNVGLDNTEPAIDVRSFDEAARQARSEGATTALITGKGEPTLFPGQIGTYLALLREHGFAWAELQTNGLRFSQKRSIMESHLATWRALNLRWISLSVVHYERAKNRECYIRGKADDYIDLPELIAYLRQFGYRVRLSVVLAQQFLNDLEQFRRMIDFARENQIGQLTMRPATKSDVGGADNPVYQWIAQHELPTERWAQMEQWVEENGTQYDSAGYGARMFDVSGQNVCLTNCLTRNPNAEEVRQLIFWPSGDITTDWELRGACR